MLLSSLPAFGCKPKKHIFASFSFFFFLFHATKTIKSILLPAKHLNPGQNIQHSLVQPTVPWLVIKVDSVLFYTQNRHRRHQSCKLHDEFIVQPMLIMNCKMSNTLLYKKMIQVSRGLFVGYFGWPKYVLKAIKSFVWNRPTLWGWSMAQNIFSNLFERTNRESCEICVILAAVQIQFYAILKI